MVVKLSFSEDKMWRYLLLYWITNKKLGDWCDWTAESDGVYIVYDMCLCTLEHCGLTWGVQGVEAGSSVRAGGPCAGSVSGGCAAPASSAPTGWSAAGRAAASWWWPPALLPYAAPERHTHTRASGRAIGLLHSTSQYCTWAITSRQSWQAVCSTGLFLAKTSHLELRALTRFLLALWCYSCNI